MNSASVSDSRPVREIYDLGDQPPLGVVPEKMHAFCVRQERFGEPKEAWQREIIPVPNIGSKDVLVYTMATGINYNNVWAALGYPVDVIADRQKRASLKISTQEVVIARGSSGQWVQRSPKSRLVMKSSSIPGGGRRMIHGCSQEKTRCWLHRRGSGGIRPTTAGIASSPKLNHTNVSPNLHA